MVNDHNNMVYITACIFQKSYPIIGTYFISEYYTVPFEIRYYLPLLKYRDTEP